MLVYTVKRGDTLWQIAKEYQISLDALLAANPQIIDPNYVLPGSKINVPRLVNIPTDLSMELEMEQKRMMEQNLMMKRDMMVERDMMMERDNMIERDMMMERDNMIERDMMMERDNMIERDMMMERDNTMERNMAAEAEIIAPQMPVEEPICAINGARPCIYITKGGETLHSISEEWGVPLAQLHYHNYQFAQNAQLPGGERIVMPLVHDYRINMDAYNRPRNSRNRRRR